MAITLKNKQKETFINRALLDAKRQYPFWRWLFIVVIISLPLIILLYIIFNEYFYTPATGFVAYNTVMIRSSSDGYVTELKVKLGQQVTKGQLLIKFDSPLITAQLDYLNKTVKFIEDLVKNNKNEVIPLLQSFVDTANSNITDSKNTYDKFLNYKNHGDINELMLDQARINYFTAKQTYNTLLTQLKQAQTSYSQNVQVNYLFKLRDVQVEIKRLESMRNSLDLYAPIAGSVISIKTYDNEFTTKGMELLTIAGNENAWIVAYVTPADIEKVYKNKRVKIIFPDNEHIPGTIINVPTFAEQVPSSQISPLAQRQNYIVIMVKPDSALPKEYQVYGIPVKVDY